MFLKLGKVNNGKTTNQTNLLDALDRKDLQDIKEVVASSFSNKQNTLCKFQRFILLHRQVHGFLIRSFKSRWRHKKCYAQPLNYKRSLELGSKKDIVPFFAAPLMSFKSQR